MKVSENENEDENEIVDEIKICTKWSLYQET
jgi:hypothetical protein